MRIAICIPARGQMEVATAFDLVAMCAYTIKTTKHDIDLFTSAGTLIFDQRNSLVKTALEIKADYLLFGFIPIQCQESVKLMALAAE
jgi:hypothetical protein